MVTVGVCMCFLLRSLRPNLRPEVLRHAGAAGAANPAKDEDVYKWVNIQSGNKVFLSLELIFLEWPCRNILSGEEACVSDSITGKQLNKEEDEDVGKREDCDEDRG